MQKLVGDHKILESGQLICQDIRQRDDAGGGASSHFVLKGGTIRWC
jgi:hypothetical protein